MYALVLRHLTTDDSHFLTPATRFAFLIQLPVTEAEFRRSASRNRKLLTAFHIGVAKHEDLAISLVDDIEKRCEALNLKSNTEFMMANSQGVTYILPAMGHSSPYKGRFAKATDLLAIATYCQELLLDKEDLESAAPALWQKLVLISRRWISFAGNTLHSSVSNRVLWEVFVESYHLDSLIQELVILNKMDDPV
ncbi:hypothetical protein [Arthrobacter sulfonylureivorans]|uniref:Uncharacterized protein n=1 Tax=Arthrobacter sulfonylureivorans TaxID=2486855 RepID=A0ABY3W956_9MICC|nr:hypothetical protein [Arthrobacter sulfonylureivorans]UNK45663.1 hypothetical protein MNQ99_17380 [Arthrobacter sulfonylureivorans]